jgi:hypothetical protein
MLVLPVLLHLSRVSDQMCMCIFPFFPLGMLISPTGPQLRLACMLWTGRLAVDLIVPVSGCVVLVVAAVVAGCTDIEVSSF